jgi:hypothetical protein
MIDLSLLPWHSGVLKRMAIYVVLFLFGTSILNAQLLPGFKVSGSFDEQQMVIENALPGNRILINAPIHGFGEKDRVLLVIYALPNGNSI